jgi:hypothetical protein
VRRPAVPEVAERPPRAARALVVSNAYVGTQEPVAISNQHRTRPRGTATIADDLAA